MSEEFAIVRRWDREDSALTDGEIARRLARELEDYEFSLAKAEDLRYKRPLKIVCPDCDGRHLRYPAHQCRILAALDNTAVWQRGDGTCASSV